MKISNYEEQEVEITAVYFRPSNQKHKLETYPKRMIVNGQEYNFMESGMRYLIRKGQDFVKLFDVSDGQNQYRLRLDGQHWTLIGTKSTV